jgi:hypothetical protein
MGLGRRILFQAVPEAKQVKNRLHIDLHAGPEQRDAEVRRLSCLNEVSPQEAADLGGLGWLRREFACGGSAVLGL